MAAERGLPFSYAHFFGAGTENGPRIAEAYRKHFQPSQFLSEPLVNVAVHIVCAETAEEAKRLASSRNLVRLNIVRNRRRGVPSPEEALAYPYTPEERAYLEQFSRVNIDGSPEQVKTQLETVAESYQTTDITVVTIVYDFAAKIRSYELVAEVCGGK
jgi:alkanesulfonate monooxygenase SsuD/methylene tetrahydromethanopterin reductase-like flavin-dependent oxidoreductase (luciferase family)